ncbi:MAG: thiamine pyrophosphate-dependent dehydrogenase E1 component subunit alpha [Candidatus Velthaea sp.]|jgi:2-oxoisovalerate dehydrogenase E1 component alpha subunit
MAKTRPAELPSGITAEQALAMFRNMLLQRAVDTRGFQLNRQGKIAIGMGSEGHEAVQAGTGFAFVRGKDILYPYYRNTGLVLACGFPLADLFRSMFARKTDRAGGRSINNHLTGKEFGIASISSIIATQCAHAAGAAWAVRARGEHDRAVFAQFGEGATSQGEWHEAVNFAAIHKLPVIFLCENNRWAISTHISKQMAVPDVYKKAAGYGIRGVVCDGFDPIAVYLTVRDARTYVLSGAGPVIVEAKCYRFLSHTTDDDDRTYRSRDEVRHERANDPVPKFEAWLIEHDVIDGAAADALRREIARDVNRITDEIEREPWPDEHELYENVYADGPEPWRN